MINNSKVINYNMTYNKSLNIALTLIFYLSTITNNIVDSEKTINSNCCLVYVVQHISVDVSNVIMIKQSLLCLCVYKKRLKYVKTRL